MNGGTEMDVRGKQSSEKRLIDYYYLAEKIECPGEPLVYWHDIEAAPTIDAVPVVRCKDCKWGKTWKNAFGIEGFKCDLLCVDLSPEAFCSYGERKEGAD